MRRCGKIKEVRADSIYKGESHKRNFIPRNSIKTVGFFGGSNFNQ